MTRIHPTAVIDSGAELADDVEIGAFSVVGPHVKLGPGTKIMPHVFLDGWTTLGAGCTVFPFASVGAQTQDLKFKGGAPRVEIGDRTVIRESATVHSATNDGDVTRIGSGCLIMACAHIAHDCVLGNGVIVANSTGLAGHILVEDRAIVGGLVGVHQFVRIGTLSIIGGFSRVGQDVPPYMMAAGVPLEVATINSVGLERAGMDEKTRTLLKRAYKIIYRDDLSVPKALEKIEAELEPVPEIKHLVAFIRASERGITK